MTRCVCYEKAFAPGRGGVGAAKPPESERLTRGIFLVTNFVWDVEGAVLNAARTYGLTEVCVQSGSGLVVKQEQLHVNGASLILPTPCLFGRTYRINFHPERA